ncbi:MAG: COQ9 family protein [Rhodospirillales bacterium]|nr:COQ9 family protein [Rhodospirillales bacterium]MSP79467.1 COQ9 family protein [Rhodospirillales bacterium]
MAKRKTKNRTTRGARAERTTDVARLRDKILTASLRHVAFDGWTAKAMAAGAKDAGAGATGLVRAFPGGPKDAARHFGALTDRRMTQALGRQLRRTPLRTHERVAAAVRARLRILAPHREAVRRLLAFLALPFNATLAAKLLWRSADAVWRAAGDTSTDFNYYTKRSLLAGVYGSTLLFWLADESGDFAATDAFLERRIADVMKIFSVRARLKSVGDGLAMARALSEKFGQFVPPGLWRRFGQGFRPRRSA